MSEAGTDFGVPFVIYHVVFGALYLRGRLGLIIVSAMNNGNDMCAKFRWHGAKGGNEI